MSLRPLKRTVVAFDFDGTLTHTDSVMAYLKYTVGPPSYYGRALSRPRELWDSVYGHRDGSSKLALINAILGPMSEIEFQGSIDLFYHHFALHMFRKDALDAWHRHADLGHERVIVSGSLQPLIHPFAKALGADHLMATEVKIDATQNLLVQLSPNCVRAEKVRRLRQVYGDDLRLYAAYGDTRGDREMLALAETSYYRVFKDRP